MTIVVPEDARFEIKFVGYSVLYDTLVNWLQLHPIGFRVPYPDRQVNNVYFDTYDYDAYAENLSGASARTKVRYRWYGQSQTPASGTLEVKRKRNYFGWKLRYNVHYLRYAPKASWHDIRRAMVEQVPIEAKHWLDTNPLPVLINRYYRNYFVSADGKVRATIDTHQQVWDQRFTSRPNFNHRASSADTLVVEFKFDRKDQHLANQTLQGIPLRVSRHSKYVNGTRAIQGY